MANTPIGIIQEVRAKRTLDRFTLPVTPKAKVWRDGGIQEHFVDGVVVGDVIHVEPGDQLSADGKVLRGRALTVDGSILTGESGPVGRGRTTRCCRGRS